MTRNEFQEAVEVVGSEERLGRMLLQVIEVWPADFLRGLPGHLSAGKELHSYFSMAEGPSQEESFESPEYLSVEREGDSYKLTVGICFDGTCGEGGEFSFSQDLQLICDDPIATWIH